MQQKQGGGWVTFAGLLMGVAGFAHVVSGIGALTKEDHFVEGGALFASLAVWSWFWLAVGLVQLVTCYLILARHRLGKSLGLTVAGLSLTLWFVTMGLDPWRALVVMVLDGLVIYALAVFSEQFD